MTIPKLIGIDLGAHACRVAFTQFSAHQDRFGEPQLIEFGTHAVLRSVVGLNDARDQPVEYGESVFESGWASQHPALIQTGFAADSFANPATARVNQMFLQEIARVITQTFGDRSLASIPLAVTMRAAQSSDQVKQQLSAALISAGFAEPRVVSESLAAFEYYAVSGNLTHTPGKYLVIDSGDTWTSLTLLDVADATITPRVHHTFSARYGGRDFEAAITRLILSKFSDKSIRADDWEFLHWVEKFKHVFSERLKEGATDYEEYCPLKMLEANLAISQSEFEQAQIAGDLIKRFAGLVTQTLAHGKIGAPHIARVILAGGNSRWYFVERELRSIFGADKVTIYPSPEETIVKGLALTLAREHAPQKASAPAPAQSVPNSAPAVPPKEKSRAQKEKKLLRPGFAFLLEQLGLVGFLGLGWIYAGNVFIGILALLMWWVGLATGIVALIVLAIPTSGITLLLCIPYWAGVPLFSGFLAYLAAKRKRERAKPDSENTV